MKYKPRFDWKRATPFHSLGVYYQAVYSCDAVVNIGACIIRVDGKFFASSNSRAVPREWDIPCKSLSEAKALLETCIALGHSPFKRRP